MEYQRFPPRCLLSPSAPIRVSFHTLPRLVTAREAFDDIARSILNGGAPARHAALLVAELDDFDALVKKAGIRAADSLATSVGRLLVSLLRGDDLVLLQPDGRFFLLLPGNTG